MSKEIKISDSTSIKLKEPMHSLYETGCNPEEKIKARNIFKFYSDGKDEKRWITAKTTSNGITLSPFIKMKLMNYKVLLIWLLLVVLWNFGVPNASPIFDVLVAVVLSFFYKTLDKLFLNKEIV